MQEPANDETSPASRRRALEHVRAAIALCDGAGDSFAACHLQLGADLLEDAIAARRGAGDANSRR
ncbi:MAG: hypothetical protein WDN44_10560 [Sphingomonas sp.]